MAMRTIYGTGGQNVAGPGVVWTNPSNVNGAPTGAVASRNVVVTTAETSDNLVTSLAATNVAGTLTSLSLGIRCATQTTPPVEQASLSVYLTNAAGTIIADYTPVANVTPTHGNKVGLATLRNGATYADVQTVIEAGLTGGVGPVGLYAIARNTGASTTFEVEAVWVVFSDTPTDGTGESGATDVGLKRSAFVTHME